MAEPDDLTETPARDDGRKSPDKERELRIVLIGRTGSGKSATGNTILGGRKFPSRTSAGSVTRKCRKAEATIDGRKILVVDTPGLFDTNNTAVFTREKVEECINLLSPGPHAIIFVIKLETFTVEVKDTIRYVGNLFKNEGKYFLIILFTHKDSLDYSLKDFLIAGGRELRNLVDRYGRQYTAFNNNAKGREKSDQVAKLLEVIDELLSWNKKKRCYTQELFRKDDPSWCSIM